MPHRVGGPVPVTSRVGRDKQRYAPETGGRMVAGTVPVRVLSEDRGNGDDSDNSVKLTADNVRVLLVTSRSGAGLVFPKGGWETDESCEAAAARETVEEAGVRGDLEPEPLGTFRFASSKKKKKEEDKDVTSSNGNKNGDESNGNGGGSGGGGGGGGGSGSEAQATMFALRVREELETWPEAKQRCRVWLPPGDALAACKHEWMREALRSWAARHGIGGGGSGNGAGGAGGEGNGDATASSSETPPLQPSAGGRERAAAAAVAAAKTAGLSVVPWIKIAGEEEEGDGGGGGAATTLATTTTTTTATATATATTTAGAEAATLK